MTGGPVLKSLPAAGLARPGTLLEAVRLHAPEIYESILRPANAELGALSHAMRKALASQEGVSANLSSQIYSLPPASLATILLYSYHPKENDPIRITGPDVIEFIARWKGDEESVPLPGSAAGVPSQASCGIIMPGSVQSFEAFVERWHGGPEPGCEPDPEAASSEFSAVFGRAIKAVESLASKNAGLLESMTAEVADFLACLLAAQPKTAAACFEVGDWDIVDTRNISNMQPEGAYANIGCGKDGIASINALDRRIVLVDRSALVSCMLASYASRLRKVDVDVRNGDVASTSYEAGSLGMVNAEYVLHYLSEQQIADAIGNIVPALAHNGVIHIKEPVSGCCGFESVEKINAIRRELERHGLFRLERKRETGILGLLFGQHTAVWLELAAARRLEDLHVAVAVRDTLTS